LGIVGLISMIIFMIDVRGGYNVLIGTFERGAAYPIILSRIMLGIAAFEGLEGRRSSVRRFRATSLRGSESRCRWRATEALDPSSQKLLTLQSIKRRVVSVAARIRGQTTAVGAERSLAGDRNWPKAATN
jgi:hypothetical protein